MRVFADTFFYIALINADDDAHADARRWFRDRSVTEMVTTSWVVVELADAMSAPVYRQMVAEFIRDLRDAPRTRVIAASDSLIEEGLELFGSRRDKGWSLTDCISFVVMGRERLTGALTADRHFRQAGFDALMDS